MHKINAVELLAPSTRRLLDAPNSLADFRTGLGISFDASWRLTLVTLGIIPLIVAPIAVTGSYVARVAEAAQESLVRAGGIATEAVLHMRTVRAYGIEAAVSRKFDDFLELPERQAIRKGLAGGLGAGVAVATRAQIKFHGVVDLVCEDSLFSPPLHTGGDHSVGRVLPVLRGRDFLPQGLGLVFRLDDGATRDHFYGLWHRSCGW